MWSEVRIGQTDHIWLFYTFIIDNYVDRSQLNSASCNSFSLFLMSWIPRNRNFTRIWTKKVEKNFTKNLLLTFSTFVRPEGGSNTFYIRSRMAFFFPFVFWFGEYIYLYTNCWPNIPCFAARPWLDIYFLINLALSWSIIEIVVIFNKYKLVVRACVLIIERVV